MGKVEPKNVRHLRMTKGRQTKVSPLPLPEEASDAAKFLRQAVLAYPELYFADLIVLGEGDSEQIVIPALLNSIGIPLDPLRICVVPLGGRHVQHFWRLTQGLDIPTITLLDLDLGRHGGGWGRVKTACNNLITQRHVTWEDLSKDLPRADGTLEPGENLDTLHRRIGTSGLNEWLQRLEYHDVFFSEPIDLDMCMLVSLPDHYKITTNRDASFSSNSTDRDQERSHSIEMVLKRSGQADDHDEKIIEFFPWYDELFLKNSKPSTHLQALATADIATLREKMPACLDRLCRRAKEMLSNE